MASCPSSTGSTLLAISLFYGLTLGMFLLVNFYWTELLSAGMQKASFFGLAAVWMWLTFQASACGKKCAVQNQPPAPEKDMFPEAQLHYLQGNWFEAECCLVMQLKKNPRDVETMLMLATIYRHNQRFDEAANLLHSLDLLEGTVRWKHELRLEKRKLIHAASSQATSNHGNPQKKNEPETIPFQPGTIQQGAVEQKTAA
ncbi:MAG: hypothetical protein FWC50_11385 [Planctomycetaceae bacterium]|nr:hypothetical protein [Planctomycetaceae bacterium]